MGESNHSTWGKKAPLTLMTGSHTFQNYWLSVGKGWLIQFPFVWWIPEEKWIPVADSFLQPPPTQPPTPTVWNDTCIYCHTIGGARGSTRTAFETNTTVGELGIACEGCHGPAETHASRLINPLERYRRHMSGYRDEDIVHPLHESADARANALCAQCHAVFGAPQTQSQRSKR